MSDWKVCVLSEIAEIVMGQSPKGETCNDESIGVPLLNGPTEFGTNHPFPTQYTTDPKKLSQVDDLLFCVRGSTTGKMNWSDQPYAIGRGIGAIRHKEGAHLKHFIKGVIDFNLKVLLQSATGSTFPNVSKNQLNDLRVKVPNLPTQKAIAEILSSLDDKIELNNQINQNLEALSQALFKQWFVDFEFPNEFGEAYKSSGGEMVDSDLGEIPKGWSVVNLDKLLTIKYGKDHKGIPEGQIPIYGSGGIMRFGNKALYEKASILIPRKGTLTNLFFITDPFWSVDTMFYSEIHSDEFAEFLFFWIKSLDIASMNVGSAVPSMTTKVLNQLLVLKPDESTIRAFHEFSKGVFDTTKANIKENENLKKLLDTLLPKIISGELEVLDFKEISPTLERQV